MRLTAPLAVRPVFYGLAVWLLDRAGTVWPVLIAQGLVIAHLTYLTCAAWARAWARSGSSP